jgi:RNA polymerase sporulation-specific sigma factor
MTGSRAPSPQTPTWERRLIRAARRGDRAAESELLTLYEPMVRCITAALYLPGGERDDLDQEARVGILQAIRDWDPERRVPFRCFAWLCAVREARMAVNAARARKHQPLNSARPLHAVDGDDGPALQDTIEATGCPDDDPVAKTLGRERLRRILERVPSLTELERGAVVLSASHHTRRQTAASLGVRERAVNNALQRARKKLAEPATG